MSNFFFFELKFFFVVKCLKEISNLVNKGLAVIRLFFKRNNNVSFLFMGSWFIDPSSSYGESVIHLYHQVSSFLVIIAILVLVLLVVISNTHGRFGRFFLENSVKVFSFLYSIVKNSNNSFANNIREYYLHLLSLNYGVGFYDVSVQQLRMNELFIKKRVKELHLEGTEFTAIEYVWSSAPIPLIFWSVASGAGIGYTGDNDSDPILGIGAEASQWNWDYDFAVSFNIEIPLFASYKEIGMWVFMDDAFFTEKHSVIQRYNSYLIKGLAPLVDSYLFTTFYEKVVALFTTNNLWKQLYVENDIKNFVEVNNHFLGHYDLEKVFFNSVKYSTFEDNFYIFKGLESLGSFDEVILGEKAFYTIEDVFFMYANIKNFLENLEDDEVSIYVGFVSKVFPNLVDKLGQIPSVSFFEGYLNSQMRLYYWFHKVMALNPFEMGELVRLAEGKETFLVENPSTIMDFFLKKYRDFAFLVFHFTLTLPYDVKYIFLTEGERLSALKSLWDAQENSVLKAVFTICFRFDSNLYDVTLEEEGVNPLRLITVDRSLVVPIDSPIRITTSAHDVIHSFSLPAVGVKIDSMPGRLNEAFVIFRRPGSVTGMCSELCGVNHGFMPINVEVVSYDDYIENNNLTVMNLGFSEENLFYCGLLDGAYASNEQVNVKFNLYADVPAKAFDSKLFYYDASTFYDDGSLHTYDFNYNRMSSFEADFRQHYNKEIFDKMENSRHLFKVYY